MVFGITAKSWQNISLYSYHLQKTTANLVPLYIYVLWLEILKKKKLKLFRYR